MKALDLRNDLLPQGDIAGDIRWRNTQETGADRVIAAQPRYEPSRWPEKRPV